MRTRRLALAALLGFVALATPSTARGPLGVPRAPAASPIPGFRAEGLELGLKDGQLALSARVLWLDPATRLTGVKVKAPLETDADFFQAPVTRLLGAFARHADITAAGFESTSSGLYSLSDVALQVRQGKLRMVGRKVAQVRVEGSMKFQAVTRTLELHIDKIRAGVLPVPRRVAFGVMSRILQAPWIELESPKMRIRMGVFVR